MLIPCTPATAFVDTRPASRLPQVWLNYQGDERVYFALAPGAHVRQPTFTTHPWRFHAPDAPGTLCVVVDQAIFYPPPKAQPDAAPPQAHIVLASSLPWSPRTHAAFPDAFRLEAATLLCCHHRLQHTAYSSGAAAGGTAAAGLSAVQQQQQQVCGLQGWLACLPHLSSGGRSRPGTPCSPSAVGRAAQAAGPTKSLGDLPQVLQGVEDEPCLGRDEQRYIRLLPLSSVRPPPATLSCLLASRCTAAVVVASEHARLRHLNAPALCPEP